MNQRYPAVLFFASAAVALAVAAGACGSAPRSSVSVSTDATPSTTATTQATSTTTAAAPTTSTTVSPTPSGSGACTASALTISLANYAGAGGTGYYGFNVVNTGTTPCVLAGYFGVSIYATSGQQLTATATRESVTLRGQGPTSFSLAPNGKANFIASVGETGTSSCTPIGSFDFIPPNTTSSVAVKVGSSHQGGYCGPAQIEPLQAGAWSP